MLAQAQADPEEQQVVRLLEVLVDATRWNWCFHLVAVEVLVRQLKQPSVWQLKHSPTRLLQNTESRASSSRSAALQELL